MVKTPCPGEFSRTSDLAPHRYPELIDDHGGGDGFTPAMFRMYVSIWETRGLVI